MINKKDVVTMFFPFPDFNSDLAKSSHMYVCLENNSFIKKFIKCQSFKPYHLYSNSEPYLRVLVKPNPQTNPFRRATIIDCDKGFIVEKARFCPSLSATPCLHDSIFTDALMMINHSKFKFLSINSTDLFSLNRKITPVC